MLMRHVDLSLRAKKVFLARDFELLEFQICLFQIQFGGKLIDLPLEHGKGFGGSVEVPPNFALPCIEGSFDRNRSPKLAGTRAKELGELPQVVDCAGNVA